MTAVPKIRIVTLSHTEGSGRPYDYAAILEYGENKQARIEFSVAVPQSQQGQALGLAEQEFQRVMAALQQAAR